MIMLGIGVDQWRHSPHWSKLATLLAEWRQRVRSRHELERLSERDLADMGLTRLDVVNETQKPFWEAWDRRRRMRRSAGCRAPFVNVGEPRQRVHLSGAIHPSRPLIGPAIE